MSETILYDGFHKIVEVEAEIKGEPVKRERLILPSAVSALVTDQDGDLLLVKQYRPTIGQYTWEIPAGICDKDHLTPYGIMLEELQEECSIFDFDIDFTDHSFKPFHTYFMVTGSSDATMEMFRFKCYSRRGKLYYVPDKDVEEVKYFQDSQIREMFKAGEFVDPKTIIAVLTYLGGNL